MTSTDVRTDQYETLSAILGERWACRQFLPDQVPHEVIERVLALAQRTPSWSNTQPWQVIVTEGDATDRFRAALVEHVRSGAPVAPDLAHPAGFTGPYRQRRKDSGLQLYGSLGIGKGDTEAALRQLARNFEFFGAPHVAIVSTDGELGTYGAIDTGLYINTVLLAAHTLGLASIPQASVAGYAPFIREYFALPESRRLVAAISFGYPDTTHPANGFRTGRADLDEIVTWKSA
ncbi:nitroreductase [Nocardia sp. BMG51109]|uniref:nitroreductase n=1 Tax=Nocardia sp. BMG51109 TaxID=1056816 RepID=UPI0004636D69|nr:nitroreductase [Nocardia sp. BMG51109]